MIAANVKAIGLPKYTSSTCDRGKLQTSVLWRQPRPWSGFFQTAIWCPSTPPVSNLLTPEPGGQQCLGSRDPATQPVNQGAHGNDTAGRIPALVPSLCPLWRTSAWVPIHTALFHLWKPSGQDFVYSHTETQTQTTISHKRVLNKTETLSISFPSRTPLGIILLTRTLKNLNM